MIQSEKREGQSESEKERHTEKKKRIYGKVRQTKLPYKRSHAILHMNIQKKKKNNCPGISTVISETIWYECVCAVSLLLHS